MVTIKIVDRNVSADPQMHMLKLIEGETRQLVLTAMVYDPDDKTTKLKTTALEITLIEQELPNALHRWYKAIQKHEAGKCDCTSAPTCMDNQRDLRKKLEAALATLDIHL